MAIVDLYGTTASPSQLTLSVDVSISAYTGFYSGTRQRVNHLADRLRATWTLPPCKAGDAAGREALLLGLVSSGDYLRLVLPHRMKRRGTLAGAPTVQANTAAGARVLPISTTAGATLLPGDIIGVGGNILIVGYAGATANGSGLMLCPLALPLQRSAAAGAAVAYTAVQGVWEVDADGIELSYSAPNIQAGVAVPLLQVIL